MKQLCLYTYTFNALELIHSPLIVRVKFFDWIPLEELLATQVYMPASHTLCFRPLLISSTAVPLGKCPSLKYLHKQFFSVIVNVN